MYLQYKYIHKPAHPYICAVGVAGKGCTVHVADRYSSFALYSVVTASVHVLCTVDVQCVCTDL